MLYEKLKNNNKIPFHMPGHKRNTELLGNDLPYDIDITEIEDFDNLHCPVGVIKNIENKAKKLYNSDNSFLLVNGTTCGILAGIYTSVKAGDKVLVARNCHKSVYNAIKLAKAEAVYIQPPVDKYGIIGKLSPEIIKNEIENNDIKLIVFTSPTYEGVISDVDGICNIAHAKNIPVLLDSAHGAHYFTKPKADIVIMSLHKTLPALTQCAVAHINSELVDADEFRINLSIFETSSPSYVLMSSIEKSIDFSIDNKTLFFEHNRNLVEFYNELLNLKHLKVFHYYDLGKIIIFTGFSSVSTTELADLLRTKFKIEVEMISRDYILAMSTVCDTKSDLDTLKDALLCIDETLDSGEYNVLSISEIPKKYCNSHEITEKGILISLDKCIGKISAEYIWAYPPGIPLIVPGEIINGDIISYINSYIKEDIEVYSTYGNLPYGIYCKEEC